METPKRLTSARFPAARFSTAAAPFLALALTLICAQGARAQTLGRYYPMYLSSTYDNTIYKVDIHNNKTVFTSNGLISAAHGLAFDTHGNLYVSSISNNSVIKVNSAGNQSLFTSGGYISGPRGLAFDTAGNLYVASYDNNLIVKVDTTGKQTIFASGNNFVNPRGMAFDKAGNLYVGNSLYGEGGAVVKIDPTGNQAAITCCYAGDAVMIDDSGLLWLGSIDFYSLDAFKTDGTFVAEYTPISSDFSAIYAPAWTALDYKGSFWLSDYWSYTVGTVSSFDQPDQLAIVNPHFTINSNPVSMAFSRGYTTTGFSPPIVNPPYVNTGNAGRTYPVKWTIANPDGTYQTSLSAASITYQSVACASFVSGSSVTLTATTTGASSLRYDSTANQYVYNWATPATPGCYDLIVNLDSGQTLTAYFNLQ